MRAVRWGAHIAWCCPWLCARAAKFLVPHIVPRWNPMAQCCATAMLDLTVRLENSLLPDRNALLDTIALEAAVTKVRACMECGCACLLCRI
jgi:hypothetical protein